MAKAASILDLLEKTPHLLEPRVWIRRIVIYEALGKKAVRDISLHTGLNIIKTTSPTVRKRMTPKGVIKGHGAGKTTLCRIIRYLLGETVFGTQLEMDRIRAAFPIGYVAAEIVISGNLWGVLRPLGMERNSYIAKGKTVEELSKADDVAVPANKYIETLGLDRLAARISLRHGKPATWEHVLPWFTRDEGADFRKPYAWREPSSESGSPVMALQDALFLIRSSLGFCEKTETDIQVNLDENKRKKDRIEKELAAFEHDAKVLARHYCTELQNLLIEAGVDVKTDAFFVQEDDNDLLLLWQGLVNDAQKRLENEIKGLNGRLQTARKSYHLLSFDILDANEKFKRLQKDHQILEGQHQEIVDGINAIQSRIEKINHDDLFSCPMITELSLENCIHVQERRREIFREASREMDRHNKNRDEKKGEKDQLADDLKKVQDEMSGLEEKSTLLDKEMQSLQKSIAGKYGLSQQINSIFKAMCRRSNFLKEPETDEEYSRIQKRLKKIERNISISNEQIQELSIRSTPRRKLIKEIFNQCVRLAFDEDIYAGRVIDSPQKMKFLITYHNGEKTSATFDVFSSILADVAALIYNSISKRSCLPGFMVYDSPKKYDMETGLYDTFFLLLRHLQSDFQTFGSCPFQFIITTTTPPPDSCRSNVCLELDASKRGDKGLLLRKNVVLPISESSNYQGRLF